MLGASTKESCPIELKDVGQVIAKECDGLPLAVVIIAGILLRKDKNWWIKIAEKVPDYVVRDKEQSKKVVRWSYDILPDHLKVCFLYIGIFPEDFEIPVRKLASLWIAEGFIEQKQDISREETAEEYLEELIDKNLVLVGKRTSDGQIKTCRIHDMMHDLCRKLALEDNLFNVVKDPRNFLSSNTDAVNMCRRLCVHSSVMDYVKSNPSAARTRSFLSIGVEGM